MLVLILGLLLFLGVHSVNLFAPNWRVAQIERLGILPWKGIYALLSLVGLVLIIWGYALSRYNPVVLYFPPMWTRHLASLLTLPAFILLVATYLPMSKLKARVGHPMLLGVKFWALAHLLANGMLADLLLFGGFLVWATALYVVSRQRDRLAGRSPAAGSWAMDALAITLGVVFWAAFAMWLHVMLIGVAPFIRG